MDTLMQNLTLLRSPVDNLPQGEARKPTVAASKIKEATLMRTIMKVATKRKYKFTTTEESSPNSQEKQKLFANNWDCCGTF